MKYTAKTKKTKPIKWLILNVSVRKNKSEKSKKTLKVITSWITFSSTRLNIPPFPW